MLLVVADFPDGTNSRDGMMQRVRSIDTFFAGHGRTYIMLRFFRHLFPKRFQPISEVTVWRLNAMLHLPIILWLGWRASGIYIHSIHNGFRALPLYFFHKVVTDLHGVFPEELRYYGKHLAAKVYGLVERFILTASRTIVTVTDAMARHYREHIGFRTDVLVVPIVDEIDLPSPRHQGCDGPLTVIYAGGCQRWQNVELMVEAMARNKTRFRYVILSNDLVPFQRLLSAKALEEVILRSVSKEEVYDWYGTADLGFILRDDTIVNRVACPTKLVEYMQCGVVPIVLQPHIGDFEENGYAFLSLERFLNGDIPGQKELNEMRLRNNRIIERLRTDARERMQQLVGDIVGWGTKTP